MTDQSDIHAKSSKIGRPPHVKKVEHARPIRPALETLWINRVNHKVQKRLAPEDIHARLILIIGATLAITFLILVFSACYALVFVTQPMKQSPNDAAFIDLLKTLAIFLTGSLGGVLAGNGLKSKGKSEDPKQ